MSYLKALIASAILLIGAPAVSAMDLLYRHSIQANVAGLVFNRYGLGYEFRITPKHALFVEAGGSIFSKEKEHGAGLHFRLYKEPEGDAKLLWLFPSDYALGFKGLNIRGMKVDGIYRKNHSGQNVEYRYGYEAFFFGVHVGKTYYWDSGFTISYRFGYGIPIGKFQWNGAQPGNGNSFDKFYKTASGLDFGLSLGFSL